MHGQRPMADHLDDRHIHLASCAQVQVVPTAHLDPRSGGIQPLPGLIRFPMRARVVTRKTLPTVVTGGNGKRPRQVAFEA